MPSLRGWHPLAASTSSSESVRTPLNAPVDSCGGSRRVSKPRPFKAVSAPTHRGVTHTEPTSAQTTTILFSIGYDLASVLPSISAHARFREGGHGNTASKGDHNAGFGTAPGSVH